MVAQRVIITGHNGFLGSTISKHLKARADLIGLGRTTGVKHPYNCCAEAYGLDLTRADAVDQVLSEIGPADALIHTAALISWERRRRAEIRALNVHAVRRLVARCVENGVKHFLFVSAGARFGFCQSGTRPLDENASFIPPEDDPYARSKYDAEQVLASYAAQIRISIVYPSTVYGPGDMKLNSGTLIKLLGQRALPVDFPGGTSLVDVRDCATAIAAVLQSEPPGPGLERYIISAENLSYGDLFRRIRQHFVETPGRGMPIPRACRPLAVLGARIAATLPGMRQVGFLNPPVVEGFFRYRYFDTSKARQALRWAPAYALEASVRDAVAFYQAHGLWNAEPS